MLACRGRVQRERDVIHVVAEWGSRQSAPVRLLDFGFLSDPAARALRGPRAEQRAAESVQPGRRLDQAGDRAHRDGPGARAQFPQPPVRRRSERNETALLRKSGDREYVPAPRRQVEIETCRNQTASISMVVGGT
jgi:hypothetical protein